MNMEHFSVSSPLFVFSLRLIWVHWDHTAGTFQPCFSTSYSVTLNPSSSTDVNSCLTFPLRGDIIVRSPSPVIAPRGCFQACGFCFGFSVQTQLEYCAASCRVFFPLSLVFLWTQLHTMALRTGHSFIHSFTPYLLRACASTHSMLVHANKSVAVKAEAEVRAAVTAVVGIVETFVE